MSHQLIQEIKELRTEKQQIEVLYKVVIIF